jgi:hypothetical protein
MPAGAGSDRFAGRANLHGDETDQAAELEVREAEGTVARDLGGEAVDPSPRWPRPEIPFATQR